MKQELEGVMDGTDRKCQIAILRGLMKESKKMPPFVFVCSNLSVNLSVDSER